jgi:hypothetical protein
MAVSALFGNNLQKYTFFGTFASVKQKKSKVGGGGVHNAINGLLCKVAVGIPKQVVKLVGKAVVNTPYSVLFAVWRVSINITSSSKILQFAAKPPRRGGCSVCFMA